jgi:prolyl-tRNA synthetase
MSDKKRNKKDADLSAWYLEVVQKAELADYAPVKGCMVIRPNGYAIWEKIVSIFDQKIKAMGVRNASFPLFIPESFIHKEKAHLEGFSPELAVVTIGGGKTLEEPLVVRPTSETIMYAMFSKWIRSWRDLPLSVNQWCNIVRWEKRTFPFLRTLEFLWQEGHTAHETSAGADKQTLDALAAYRDFIEDFMAIPVLTGKKSDAEKFAGAFYTTSCEALMPDGKALQVATSHNLGQNFSKQSAFNISFQTRDKNGRDYVWQTSWGLSTRIIGALIMVHGDDQGLIFPPKIAPLQVIVVPIYKTDGEKVRVVALAQKIVHDHGQKFSMEIDTRESLTPGFKFNDWELKGVPVRLEIGPRDVEKTQVVVVRRDNGEKSNIGIAELNAYLQSTMDDIQSGLYKRALDFRESHTYSADTLEDFKKIIEEKRGFVTASWCGNPDCEAKVKEVTKATVRVIPFNQPEKHNACMVCGKQGKSTPVWARAY